jgi:thiol-disulfide isomerase/thioredoxin
MTRTARFGRRLPWAGVSVLLLAACGTGTPDGGTGEDPALARLRAAAAVSACPSGVGPALPDLTLPCLSGGPDVALAAPGTGRPTLVNVWATWCSPCVREVPELVELAAAGRVDVVGVLTQDTARNGLEFARQFGMRYPSVVDDGGVVMRAYSPGPPVTLFLDAGGRVRHVQRGEIRDSKTLRALVRQHLAVDPTPGGTS